MRKVGLAGAFVSRLGLLAMLSWIVRLDQPLFNVAGKGFSGKALILLGGGLFLLYKATKEIHHKLEAADGDGAPLTRGGHLRRRDPPDHPARHGVLDRLGDRARRRPSTCTRPPPSETSRDCAARQRRRPPRVRRIVHGPRPAVPFEPLDELIDGFIEKGGIVWACSPCYQHRGVQSGAATISL